jgi:hypothetical protein
MAGNDAPKLDPKEHPYVFSASQIETAQLCLRKWAFEKIDRLPKVTHPSAALGTLMHDQLEAYLKYARPIDTSTLAGKIAMSGIQHLPPPRSPGMRVEEWFVRKHGKATYWGKKDYSFKQYFGGLPLVGDHKSCGAFTWAKTEQDLQTTVQSGMYGWDAIEEADSNAAKLNWVYFRTQGARKSLPVFTTITKMQAEDVMEAVTDTSELLIAITDSTVQGQAIEIPANYAACEAYGGCPRKEICKPTAKGALEAIMTQKTNESLLADLRNRKQKKVPAPVADAATQAKVEEDKKETVDPINPPERDAPPPPPPSPLQVGGKWFQPQWDEAEYVWKFSDEYHAAVKAEADAKRAAEKAAEKSAKRSSVKKDSEEASAPAPVAVSSNDIVGVLVELIAQRVVELLAEKGK